MSYNKTEFRELKIKLLNDDVKLSFNNSCINNSEKVLDFISNNFKDDIITGSLALHLYGLINHRSIKDVDILIKDKSRYSGYIKGGGYDDIVIPNRLGYKEFEHVTHSLFGILSKKVTYDVDFFLELENTEYTNLNYKGFNLKIHNPIQILSHKIDMAEKDYKHRQDLYLIFNSFN
jgi:hypothetical protein